MNARTYPWPTNLGPLPVAVNDGKVTYTEAPTRRFCDDPAVLDYYKRNGMHEQLGRLVAAQ